MFGSETASVSVDDRWLVNVGAVSTTQAHDRAVCDQSTQEARHHWRRRRWMHVDRTTHIGALG